MVHLFDVKVAQQVGVEKAILLYNLDFWIRKNKANGTHLYDGRTWTYNSGRAFAELFPYMKAKSIARWLRELEKDGFLMSSQEFNENSYDKTKWFSLLKKYYSIAHFEQSDTQNEQTIPDVNTDKKNTPYSPSQGACVGDKQPKTKGRNPGGKGAAVSSNNGELFEQFWTVYPRKVGRKKCLKIWERLKPSAELVGQIVTKVRVYSRTEQWQEANGKYIPHPATWLNEGRWEDDIPTKPEPQRGDPDWLPTEQEAEEIMRDAGLIK